jgi:para-nitrobenzyl esterase
MRLFNAPCGRIEALVEGKFIRALGIPYARANRFALPKPVQDWSTTYQAKSPSPACPQKPKPLFDNAIGESVLKGLQQDENCQNLSITLPSDIQPHESLPVMVWIHGGANICAAGDSSSTDPSALVEEQRVIVVSITYRISTFGFAPPTTTRPGNLGLFDIYEGLKWIQRNIGSFGGNTQQITVFGQSAGAYNILHLLTVEGIENYFQQAIIQSPPLAYLWKREKMLLQMNSKLSIDDRLLSVDEMLTAETRFIHAAKGCGPCSMMPFGPVLGYPPLPQEIEIETKWSKIATKIPLLIGCTSEEVRFFTPAIPSLHKLLNTPIIGSLVNYFVQRSSNQIFNQPTFHFANNYAKSGGRVYHYTLNYKIPNNHYGAAHAMDLPLLFGFSQNSVWEKAPLIAGSVPWDTVHQTGQQMRHIWGQFAKGQLQGNENIPGALKLEKL